MARKQEKEGINFKISVYTKKLWLYPVGEENLIKRV